MFCSACQKELEDGALKCPYCGKELSDNSQEPSTESSSDKAAEVETTETEESVETAESTQTEAAVTAQEPLAQASDTAPQNETETVSDEEFFKKYNLYFTDEGEARQPTRKAPQKKKSNLILLPVCILAVVVLAVVATVVFSVLGKDDDSSLDASSVQSEFVESASNEDTSSENELVLPEKLTNDTIVGDWELQISVSEMEAAQNPESVNNSFETDAVYKLYLRFNADKTLQLVCDVDDYKVTYAAYMEDYFQYLRNGGYYELREKEGYSKEQTDKMLADTGMTVDLLVDDLEEKMQSNDVTADKPMTDDGYIVFTDPAKTTKYTLEKNKIVFVTDEDLTRETYISFEFASGVITVTEGTYADGMLVQKNLTKKQ